MELRQRLLALDVQYTNSLRIAEQPGTLRNLAILLAHSGDSWFWLTGLVFLWVFGTEPWKWHALVMFSAILATAALVMSIKFTVRRRRPEGEWGQLYRKTDPHSFPSGHAARAAMLAILAIGIGPAWFALLLLIWAPLVTLARVAMGLHYLSDVIAGGFLGVLIGLLMLIILSQFASLF